ncbi:Sad1/UNC domain-containing protein [Sarocladium implicatum]|nr:Sad1/UNC domain-containing protein [Sarocladium implicatum]
MRKVHTLRDLVILILHLSQTQAIDRPTISLTTPTGPHPAIETGTCEARTINHVTHTLPPLCLTSTWSETSTTSSTAIASVNGTDPSASEILAEDTPQDEGLLADVAGAPFMSFEDWKEEMLQRTGQDPQDLNARKNAGHRRSGDSALPEDGGSAWGDEEEIALDFGEYRTPRANHHDGDENDTERPANEQHQDSAVVYDHNKGSLHRSKDAGKTCKERFSYSSFDAGATILKTGSGTKNAKAILVENKDSYMLLECGRDNKFVIVELSDDILLDTVVIANFEFFSSMIRHFRISVSDRYPVKVDKWKELGTFEARNSRDIQAFLVENPQIWAKYVRLEFLTHYGNEFYCPVSLVRIHGSRMLDSWKEADSSREEDSPDDDCEGQPCEELVGTEVSATQSDTSEEPKYTSTSMHTTPTSEPMTSMDLFAIFAPTCPELPAQLTSTTTTGQASTDASSQSDTASANQVNRTAPQDQSHTAALGDATISDPPAQTPDPRSQADISDAMPEQEGDGSNPSTTGTSPPSQQSSNTTMSQKPSQASHASKHPQSGSPGSKSRSSPTVNAAAASPTVQEGFFNSITKRLVQVETNLTLSMKYVEGQSRHVQEAMQRMEHKQTQRITLALEMLNQTVLGEMRSMREQYEQLWHSTILALESQRERTEQDAVALSARLNLLADEVVFQKRMAMAQAVLLLSCLCLVIFSRGAPIPYLAHAQQNIDAGSFGPPHNTNALLGAQKRDIFPPDTGGPRYNRAARLLTPLSTHDADQADDTETDPDSETSEQRLDRYLHTTQSRFHRASSPHVSRAPGDDDLDCRDLASEGSSVRLPASDQHNARKPLPALPEHPLSP